MARKSSVDEKIQSAGDPFNKAGPRIGKTQDASASLRSSEGRSTEPGLGIASPPVPVRLTSTDLTNLAEEFSSEIEYQYSSQLNLRQNITNWLTIYRGKPKDASKDYPLAHASNVVVKLAKIYTDQVVARIMQGIFGPEPHWIMQELNKKYAEAVKPYERYMDWARKNMWDQRKVVLPLVQDTVKLGTSILYNDFVDEPIFRYDDKNSMTVETGRRKGPKPVWVPREDFLIPEGFQDIQVAPYISHRVWFSWDLLEKLSYRGFIENLDELKGQSDEEDDVRAERRQNQPMVTMSHDDRFGLWSPRYVWFRRDLDQDGWPEEYVMLLHTRTKTILRLVANPSPAGIRPFCVSKFINVEGAFDGIGIPEDIELLQEEASTIHNQRRDRAHLANIVMYIARNVGGLPDSIRPASGKVIKTTDTNDIKEFHPSTNVPIDIAEEDAVMKLAALTVGMNDVDMGKASSPVGRAAATTIMALMQEGARRFDLNVAELRSALTEQGHQITELWQIYGLPPPEDPASPESVLDDKDAAAVRALLETTNISLRGLIGIQLNIATAAVNKETEKQANIQLYQVVSQYMQQMLQFAPVLGNPQVPEELKAAVLHAVKGQDRLLEQIFQSHNKFDLDSVLVGELFEQMAAKSMQQAQQMQQMQQMGMTQGAPQPGQPQGQPPQPQGRPLAPNVPPQGRPNGPQVQ